MRALFIHLSDLHITDIDHPTLERVDHIADAVKNLDYEIEMALLILSGDITQDGSADAFAAAALFADELQSRLHQALAATCAQVHLIAVPGNHDCDLAPSQARDLIIKGLANSEYEPDSTVINACLGVQSRFMEFISPYLSPDARSELIENPTRRLVHEIRIPFATGSIRLVCVNTAWLSQLREVQGQLAIPISALPPPDRNAADVVLSIFHHPYNWLAADNARSFRKRIESLSDIVLTGHEHDPTRRDQVLLGGERNCYIEGGALFDPAYPGESAFNALVIDTRQRKQKYAQFRWDGSKYAIADGFLGHDGSGLRWEDFELSRLREHGGYELSPAMELSLNDLGLSISRSTHEQVQLNSIFVWPDLRVLSMKADDSIRSIRGPSVVDFVASHSRLLITGDEKSGKSCLARMLFRALRDRGHVPLLVDGGASIPAGDKAFGYLESLFCQQYGDLSLSNYQQLDRSKRTLIVDDVHRLSREKGSDPSLVDRLGLFAETVVLIGNDLLVAVDNLVRPGTDATFVHAKIQPFGRARRHELVEKWLLLDEEASRDTSVLARQIGAMTTTVDTIIGENFVPSYPIYILPVLQAHQAATPLDMRASTYGYFYELLIRSSIATSTTAVAYDVLTSYLAGLAYRLFQESSQDISKEAFHRFHSSYEQRYGLAFSFNQIQAELLRLGLLTKTGDLYRFRYPYIFFFFVATFLRDHITDPEVRNSIVELSRSLDREDSANVFVFLAHLSKDPLVIDTIVKAAGRLFKDVPPSNLEEDIQFLKALGQPEIRTQYVEGDPVAKQRRQLQAMDESDARERDRSSDDDAWNEELGELRTAFRTMQILGQLLKNFPGSIEAESKYGLARECYGLGRRALGSLLTLIGENRDDLVQQFSDLIREAGGADSETEATNIAREMVSFMVHGVSLGVVRKIAGAAGSPQLSLTHSRLLQEEACTAVRLVHAAISLEHDGEFPLNEVRTLARDFQKNPVGLFCLRWLVVHHLDLFDVHFSTKQSLCDLLGISFRKMTISSKVRRMIAG